MSNKRNLRSRKLIHYKGQGLLLFNNVVTAVLGILVTHLYYFQFEVSEILVPFLGAVDSKYFWLIPLPLLLACILWGFAISNRIFGPIYNLERHIQGIAAGQITGPARARKEDFFGGLFDAVNSLIASDSSKSRPDV